MNNQSRIRSFSQLKLNNKWILNMSSRNSATMAVLSILVLLFASTIFSTATAAPKEKPVTRNYSFAPPAPERQSAAEASAKSSGCMSCHVNNDQPSMHANPAVNLGCVDCHGGNSEIAIKEGLDRNSADYQALMDSAHVLPLFPKSWNYPSSANPERTYTLLNRESAEFIRFLNPSDYRVADTACGIRYAIV